VRNVSLMHNSDFVGVQGYRESRPTRSPWLRAMGMCMVKTTVYKKASRKRNVYLFEFRK